MKLVPFNVKDIAPRRYKLCANQKVIQEFLDSGLECAKVEDYTQHSAYCCTKCLSIAIKSMNVGTVCAITRKGNVYLIKTTEKKD